MAEELYPTALVVDDDDESRLAVRRMLESRGFRVTEATDGREAIEAAHRLCPDLVLMDLNLPGVDGLEAARRVREQTEGCANTVLVAFADCDAYGMREAAIEAGFSEYVVEPVTSEGLGRVLRHLLLEPLP